MKPIFTFLALICFNSWITAQEAIEVTDQTLKVQGLKEETLYFGFEAGDKVIFTYREVDGKELKELEVLEYPGNSKFSEYKVTNVERKQFLIAKRSVYVFRFKNTSLSGRICKVIIQRIPTNELAKGFNTAVRWMDIQDTTWTSYTKDVLIGYDTLYEQKSKKQLIKTEVKEELLFDKTQRVHSTTNENGSKTSLFFTLPQNQLYGNHTSKVVSWAYWVGVGEEGSEMWKANVNAVSKLVNSTAGYFTSPLGALALGAVSDLAVPKIGEDVYYALTDQINNQLFLKGYQFKAYDYGKGVAAYKKIMNPLPTQGTWYISLSNDNVLLGIDVDIKVVALIEYNTYEDVTYTDTVVRPKYEKRIMKEPVISTKTSPVAGLGG